MASQNRILTADRLSIMSIEGPSRCVLCKHDSENIDHILYRCPYMKYCWDWLTQMLGWTAPMSGSLDDCLKGWPIDSNKCIYRKL